MIRTLLIIAQTSITGGSGGEINIPTTTPSDSGSFTGNVLGVVFAILGALSLLFVVIGGMRYVLSAGDPKNTQQARDTILYALIGLLFSIFAFSIVNFVLDKLAPDDNASLTGPNGLFTQIIQLVVYATGVISVIMIIYGALRYVVSGGDPNSTRAARDTIIYALVGLVIAISAQAIVTFVLEKVV